MVTTFPFRKQTDGIAKFQCLRCKVVSSKMAARGEPSRIHVYEVGHNVRIVNLGILRVVTPSLNRHGSSGLDKPTGKCPLAELSGFCSEPEETAFL